MNALVPLNVTAIRVSANDRSNIVSQFKGRTAVFEKMPYQRDAKQASTGDTIVLPLESNASPQDPLGIGIHVHWELPDYFRRGTQPAQGGDVVFPQAPNRWLVMRYLTIYNTTTKKYGPVQTKGWIIESDYVADKLTSDSTGVIRPAVSVPIPINPQFRQQPYKFMGRVVDLESWNPAMELPSDYLPYYKGANGQPLYLTSIGFVGPSFSAYYPECLSVFGFWDHFKDVPAVYGPITGNTPIQFKVSYEVIGWINEPGADPLTNIHTLVAEAYDRYVRQCARENVPVVRTPADDFVAIALQRFRWEFCKDNITFTLKPDKILDTLNVPQRTLCGGVEQEIVWNMLSSPQTSYFLRNPNNPQSPAVWTDTVELAVGNTTVEALSALLKKDMETAANDTDVLDNYEYLLNALQLGILRDLETHGNALITLEENTHSKAFSSVAGGYLWVVEQKQQGLRAGNPEEEVNLPLHIAEQLSVLNQTQKDYDQGRAALDAMRKQLFMDWLRYVKIYVSGIQDPNVNINDLTNFVSTPEGGERGAVVEYGKAVGMLLYLQDPITGEITGIEPPLHSLLPPQFSDPVSQAIKVWNEYQKLLNMLVQYPLWQLRATTAMPFSLPTDPVLVMEGARLQPVRRNGPGPNIGVRVSGELLNTLQFGYQGNTFTISTGDLLGVPRIPDLVPLKTDVQGLVNETYLLVPMLGATVADALKAKGGSGNPAVSAYAEFVTSLNLAQGGLSPAEGGTPSGLFEAVHGPIPITKNPTETVSTPLALSVTFTNEKANGWPPDAVAWNTQPALPEFTANRYDPFLPVFLLWTAQLEPLKRDDGASYGPGNLTNYFHLDADGVDYQYTPGTPFTTGRAVRYQRSITLSKATTYSLTNQIDSYIRNYPTDEKTDAVLEEAKAIFLKRQIISQGLSGFDLEQTLRTLIPKVPVFDLVKGSMDTITTAVNDAALANPIDNWYNFGFNGNSPIDIGPLAQHNFGPFRSGFAELFTLEIVDVFGQRMTLKTSATNPDGSLQTIVAQSLKPAAGDTLNKDKIFFPPRLLAPSRLWFAWLSASHPKTATSDFVEMNFHPATTPVFGWVMPNHLDNSLFFYDADGAAIGSFGVEHNDLKYRTRAGNPKNPEDLLQIDIGPKGSPTVNPHVADFMWYIDGKDAPFLLDLMKTVENSDKFINPVRYAQDPSLAVLIGRPLALTRAVIGLETSGTVLPLSQADVTPTDPFPSDVKANRFRYFDRQQTSSAKLGGVEFPVRLGDLANIDDGLVGYLIEIPGASPYGIFYSPAAPADGTHGVERPKPDTIELTLNSSAITVTMLVDPRAPVHATTGILPVQIRQVPPDQYSETVRSLAVTFFTHPMLSLNQRLIVPLPQESDYQWSWITYGSLTPLPLTPNSANEFATFGYTPQTILEGWLRLNAETLQPLTPPKKPENPEE
jgi:hypothetical protein